MDELIGEIAALAAAAIFSITSVCYTFAGRKVNAIPSIAMSLPTSWLMIVGIHQATLGELFPTQATLAQWFFLGMSGILAFVISSYFMLNAYQSIGPRLTMLIATLTPIAGALLAWIFLGQSLPPDSIIGIAVVTFGIVWVVAERGSKANTNTLTVDLGRGVTYATLGTLLQAAAFVFASQGLAGGFPPVSATLIRITVGVIALWVFIAWQRNLRSTATIFNHDLKLFLQLTAAALTGPVIAGSLVLLSFRYIPVGVSTTLSHTTAIFLIPIGYYVFHERITLRAVIGTIVTVVGIGILFI